MKAREAQDTKSDIQVLKSQKKGWTFFEEINYKKKR